MSSHHSSLLQHVYPGHLPPQGVDLLDEVLPTFLIDDPVDQQEVARNLYFDPDWQEDDLNNFSHQVPAKSPLSLLRNMGTVSIDEGYTVDPLNRDIAWNLSTSFLDLCVCVPRAIGLHALIPPSHVVDIHYAFEIAFSSPHKEYKSRYALLGFDPTGVMLSIGTLRSEEVWLVLATKDTYHPTPEFPPGSSRMSATFYHMVLMFLAATLDSAGLVDIQTDLFSRYPDNIKELKSVKEACNILNSTVTRSLRQIDVERWHRAIVTIYPTWLAEAPAAWRKAFSGRIPFCITSAYGQNQPILPTRNHQEQRISWTRSRNYKDIRHITFAIATDVRCSEVHEWIERPLEEILDALNGDNVYDTPLSSDELDAPLDLATYPLYDEEGHENNVYNVDGFRIPRLLPRVSLIPYGVLFDFRRAEQFFGTDRSSFADEAEHISDETPAQSFYNKTRFFPVAGCKNLGHFQSSILPSIMAPVVETINDVICKEHDMLPLKAVSCQGYNELLHRTRYRHESHDAQQGDITAWSAGLL
ncbi:hypothetical protein EW026_g5892 [Hermanssonia centrifuga]|uniref:DUF8190 domain-containing protein n=1 Tax=Hermanssonia centrifuga TaxID=98765 RepID=A0A4S4KCS5_9APHY|nr:hypothetical protein EW026_g5892 [Hermanssonia centrifuga]